MDIKELTDLLVISSQRTNQSKYIPWWEDDFENCIYRYDIFEDETVQDINALVKDCGKDALLAPVGYYGLTLFHLLVWHNFYDAVKDLLDSGAFGKDEVNLPDLKGHGLTPFLLAVFRGNLAMTRLLLDHGADDSLCDERGMNAYHFLEYPRFEGLVNFRIDESIEQRTEIARLLTCDINQKNQEGLTPLEQMLSLSHSSNFSWALTEIFLEKGATTDYIDENGNTLLMMALRNNHMTAALMLMDRYSDMVNTANKDGITPIQHALDWRNDVWQEAINSSQLSETISIVCTLARENSRSLYPASLAELIMPNAPPPIKSAASSTDIITDSRQTKSIFLCVDIFTTAPFLLFRVNAINPCNLRYS